MVKKIDTTLISLIGVSFIVYAIATFIGNDFLMDLLSPVTVGLVLVLVLIHIPELGNFKYSTIFMAIGIFIWFTADILYFLDDFVMEEPGILGLVANDLYLYPNACFAVCISVYMISMLFKKRIEVAFLMSNTLCFAIIGFSILYRLHSYLVSASSTHNHYRELPFIFISFFTIMMCIQLLLHIGIKNAIKGTVFTNLGVIFYAFLDLDYDFKLALDMEAENDYLNLCYVLAMVLMGLGIYIQLKRKYLFPFIPRDFSKKATKNRFIFMSFLLIANLQLTSFGLFTKSLFLYNTITLLSYLITNYVFYSENLDRLMLANQKEQNTLLEQKVKDKTRELENANETLRILSTTDMLTGLQNRRSCAEYLNELVAYSQDNGRKFALFCSDLNHFKPVNDTYGHEIGDLVLSEFGKRMNGLPERFAAFRVGGDEFLICARDIEDRNDAEEAAKTLRLLFNTPIISDNYIFNLSASIGIAIYPDDCSDIEMLKSYADTAMYDIKKSRNKDNYKFFDTDMTHIIERKEAIANAVEKAEPERDFLLHYQPQVNADTGEIDSVEVYPHLKGDMENVSPAELVPIAEECGLMSRLGVWIVKESLRTISEWNKTYSRDLGFTINLSPLQLTDAEFIEALEKLSKAYGFNTGKISLDISNEVIVGATGSAKDIMEALHNYGFKLCLNDFSGNHINLSYLMDCGINCIELSRTLISKVEKDDETKTLVQSIISFAATMGVAVAGVGIETKSQYDLLHRMGVSRMQGYLISKPVSHDDFEKLLV